MPLAEISDHLSIEHLSSQPYSPNLLAQDPQKRSPFIAHDKTTIPLMASPISSETIVNIVFGILASIVGFVTVWQGYKAWGIWRKHRYEEQQRYRNTGRLC